MRSAAFVKVGSFETLAALCMNVRFCFLGESKISDRLLYLAERMLC